MKMLNIAKTGFIGVGLMISSLFFTGCEYGTLDPLDVPEKSFQMSVLEGESVVFYPPGEGLEGTTTYIITYPSHGKAEASTGGKAGVEYTPDTGYVGADQFTVDFLYQTRTENPDENTSGTGGAQPSGEVAGYRYIVDVTVKNVNDSPTITGSPAPEVKVDQRYSFTPIISDKDNPISELTVSVSGLASWMTYDATTFETSGVPLAANEGDIVNITYVVSDGIDSTELFFSIIVIPPNPPAENNPPVISGVMSSDAIIGQLYSFVPTATDADGDTLVFSIANKPAWASFNTTIGELSGTPLVEDNGTVTVNVTISVSDSKASVALSPSTDISVVE